MTESSKMQHRLRKEIAEVLGQEALKAMHRPHGAYALLATLHIWASIALCFWLAGRSIALPLALSIPSGILLAAFMATRINALNVLVHEGSHYALAARRSVNSVVANWLAGYWILFDEDGYRGIHLRHHTDLNEPTDPDFPLYRLGRHRAGLVFDFLGDLLWISVAKRAVVYWKKGRAKGKLLDVRRLQHLAAKGGANLVLLGTLLVCEGLRRGLFLYIVFWVVPLLSLYPVIIRLRLITEHFAPEIFEASSGPVFVARTSEGALLERYLLGAQMEYHFEHHLFPGVPYRNLKRMHRSLTEKGFFGPDSPVIVEHSVSGGYLTFWRHLLRGPYLCDAPTQASRVV